MRKRMTLLTQITNVRLLSARGSLRSYPPLRKRRKNQRRIIIGLVGLLILFLLCSCAQPSKTPVVTTLPASSTSKIDLHCPGVEDKPVEQVTNGDIHNCALRASYAVSEGNSKLDGIVKFIETLK